MNTKSMIVGVVVILALAVGGYFFYQSRSSASASNPEQAAAANSDQVQGQDVKVGTGPEAGPNDTVSVLYVGKFSDGTVFDSSAAHGNQPITFVLGAQGIIPGLQIGINTMKEGGERLLAIPPSLGYGGQDMKDASSKVVIPANSTLLFDVQLVKVVKATTTTTAQ